MHATKKELFTAFSPGFFLFLALYFSSFFLLFIFLFFSLYFCFSYWGTLPFSTLQMLQFLCEPRVPLLFIDQQSHHLSYCLLLYFLTFVLWFVTSPKATVFCNFNIKLRLHTHIANAYTQHTHAQHAGSVFSADDKGFFFPSSFLTRQFLSRFYVRAEKYTTFQKEKLYVFVEGGGGGEELMALEFFDNTLTTLYEKRWVKSDGRVKRKCGDCFVCGACCLTVHRNACCVLWGNINCPLNRIHIVVFHKVLLFF